MMISFPNNGIWFVFLASTTDFCSWASADGSKSVNGSTNRPQRLGPAGLALHYANIIIQVDTLVFALSDFIILYVMHLF